MWSNIFFCAIWGDFFSPTSTSVDGCLKLCEYFPKAGGWTPSNIHQISHSEHSTFFVGQLDQAREDFNLANVILELAFSFSFFCYSFSFCFCQGWQKLSRTCLCHHISSFQMEPETTTCTLQVRFLLTIILLYFYYYTLPT